MSKVKKMQKSFVTTDEKMIEHIESRIARHRTFVSYVQALIIADMEKEKKEYSGYTHHMKSQ